MFFFFDALPIDQSKIKHTKKLKEIPSRHFLENLPEKTSMYAFIHLKLIGNLHGFCQYIMADMLNLTIADYKTLPKALRTQALTALTSNFGLEGLVQYAW